VRPQRPDKGQPAGEQLGARTGQLVIPRIERRRYRRRQRSGRRAGRRPGAWQTATRGFQQCRPLPHHPLIIRTHRGVPRCGGHQEVVEEPPPLRGIALHHREVLRCEQHRAEYSEDLAGPWQRRPVQPHPVGPARIELDLHEGTSLARRDRRPDDGAVRAVADERGVRGHPVAAQRGDIADRLGQVGLPLAVRPAQGRHSRREHQVRRGVGPEIGECEPC
jgi:hypothetical protein